MTPDEHYRRAEVLLEMAQVFEKRLYEATQTLPGGAGQRRAPVPLGVTNYLAFLQTQALGHATLAQTVAPSVWSGSHGADEQRLPQDPGNENIGPTAPSPNERWAMYADKLRNV